MRDKTAQKRTHQVYIIVHSIIWWEGKPSSFRFLNHYIRLCWISLGRCHGEYCVVGDLFWCWCEWMRVDDTKCGRYCCLIGKWCGAEDPFYWKAERLEVLLWMNDDCFSGKRSFLKCCCEQMSIYDANEVQCCCLRGKRCGSEEPFLGENGASWSVAVNGR